MRRREGHGGVVTRRSTVVVVCPGPGALVGAATPIDLAVLSIRVDVRARASLRVSSSVLQFDIPSARDGRPLQERAGTEAAHIEAVLTDPR